MVKTKNNKAGIFAVSAFGAVVMGAVIVGVAAVSSVASILIYKSTRDGEVAGAQNECPPCEREYYYSSSDPLGTQSLLYQANELDLDVEDFEDCLKSSRFNEEIELDKSAAEEVGITGTPGFVVGERFGPDKVRGFLIPGAYPLETFKKAIDAVKKSGVDKAFEKMTPEIRGPVYENRYQSLLQYYQSAGESGAEEKARAEAEAHVNELWQIKEVGIGSNAPKGEKSASVVIIEFTDYECPYCVRHVQETIPELEKEYISKGELAYYLRDMPISEIHPAAKDGAVSARCAGEQDKYWEMHDLLFAD